MKRWLAVSILLHVASVALVHPKAFKAPEPLTVEIKAAKPVKAVDLFKGLGGSGLFKAAKGLDIGVETKKALAEASEPNPLKQKKVIFKSYYDRMHASIDPGWIRCVRKVRPWPKGHFETVMLFVLSGQGVFEHKLLVKPSENASFDSCAVEALKPQAFPNPPKDLIDPDGKIRIVWSFNVN